MGYPPYYQGQPMYVVQQTPPEVEGAATTAAILEVVLGLFGLLGVGHLYANRILLGVVLMVGWWLFIAFEVIVDSITFGIAACLLTPLHVIFPVLSGINVRTYVLKEGEAGNWSPVVVIAGGGCLVITAVTLIVLVFLVLLTGLCVLPSQTYTPRG